MEPRLRRHVRVAHNLSVIGWICAASFACGDEAGETPLGGGDFSDPDQNIVIGDTLLNLTTKTQLLVRSAGSYSYFELSWLTDHPEVSVRIAFRLETQDIVAVRPVDFQSPSVRFYGISARGDGVHAWLSPDEAGPAGTTRARRLDGQIRVGVRVAGTLTMPYGGKMGFVLEGTMAGPEEIFEPMPAGCANKEEPIYVPLMYTHWNEWWAWEQAEGRCANTDGLSCKEMRIDVPCGGGDRYYCATCSDGVCVEPVFVSECLPGSWGR